LSASKTRTSPSLRPESNITSFGHFVKRANNDRIQSVRDSSPPIGEWFAGWYGSASRLISRLTFAGFGFDRSIIRSLNSSMSIAESKSASKQEL
jgi:hypothetical protein